MLRRCSTIVVNITRCVAIPSRKFTFVGIDTAVAPNVGAQTTNVHSLVARIHGGRKSDNPLFLCIWLL